LLLSCAVFDANAARPALSLKTPSYGSIAHASAAGLLGYSHAQFIGKAIWELGFFKDIVANEAKYAELQ